MIIFDREIPLVAINFSERGKDLCLWQPSLYFFKNPNQTGTTPQAQHKRVNYEAVI